MTSSLIRAAIITAVLAGSALPAFAMTRVVHTPRGTIVYDDQFQDRNITSPSALPARQFFEYIQEQS